MTSSRPRASLLATFLLGIALLVAGCRDQTAILVEVSSPTLEVPADVDTLEFDVRGAAGTSVLERTFPLSSTWPHSLALYPGPTESGTVDITVRGRLGATPVAESTVRAAFVPGASIVVQVVLAAAPDVDGGMGDAGGRDAGTLDASALDAGALDAGPLDAGSSDAGSSDAGPGDAGPGDAGRDADRPDAFGPDSGVDAVVVTCSASDPCDDGDPCTDDACDTARGACAHTTRDADDDGAGDVACPAVGGVPATDCDDTRREISPGAPDVCDGLDNDCSGTCDSTSTCCRGATEGCTTACGSAGMRTCGASCGWSVCSPPAEVCNGRDDDCNGACDDGLGCCSGSTSTCVTSCGSTGRTTCGADCAAGACMPPAETCNGRDDDCDMNVDEGFECQGGASRACTTSCGSTGLQTCGATCSFGACMPPIEACNGIDDNCDTVVDEGCGSCASCAGAVTVTGAGGRYMVNLAASATTGTCGGSGNEGTLTFTIAAPSDVFITTHASAVDTVVYVRSCSCTGTEVGCNDDADGLTSSVVRLRDLAPGTYNVVIDSKVAMSRTVPVDLYIAAPGMTSDRCGDPTFIPAGAATVTGDTCGYGNDYDLVTVPGAANCEYSGGGDGPDRVYYFYLPTSRSVTVAGCNAATVYDSSIYFRSVCSDGLAAAQLGCNDDGCTGSRTCDRSLRSNKTLTLGPGLFYLVVDGYSGAGSSCPCGAYGFGLTGF